MARGSSAGSRGNKRHAETAGPGVDTDDKNAPFAFLALLLAPLRARPCCAATFPIGANIRPLVCQQGRQHYSITRVRRKGGSVPLGWQQCQSSGTPEVEQTCALCWYRHRSEVHYAQGGWRDEWTRRQPSNVFSFCVCKVDNPRELNRIALKHAALAASDATPLARSERFRARKLARLATTATTRP